MITDLYLLQGMTFRAVERQINRRTQLNVNVWQVGRGANGVVLPSNTKAIGGLSRNN